jgi:hypothetical protein
MNVSPIFLGVCVIDFLYQLRGFDSLTLSQGFGFLDGGAYVAGYFPHLRGVKALVRFGILHKWQRGAKLVQ